MIARELNIGDEAWLAVAGVRQERVTCPVCDGKRTITVILGTGARVVVGCDYCGLGFEGSRGFTMEYTQAPKAERVTITSKRAVEEDGTRRVEYGSPLHFIRDACCLFETEPEALVGAQQIAAQNDLRERDTREHKRGRAISKAGWTAGYHLQRARKLHEEAERHERWAREIKAEKVTQSTEGI